MESDLLTWDLHAPSCMSQLLTLRDMDMCLREKKKKPALGSSTYWKRLKMPLHKIVSPYYTENSGPLVSK